MFCPKCGANLPEDATSCVACGYQMQDQQSPAVHVSAKERGISKKDFLATEASETARKSSKISQIAFIAAVILVIVSVIVANNTAFYKLPIISLVLSDSEQKEIEEDLKMDSDIFDEARDLLDEIEDDLAKKEYKAIKKFIDRAEKIAENPSLAAITDAVDQAEKVAKINRDRDVEDRFDFDSVSSINEVWGLLHGITTATYIFAVVVILLALLSFFKKSIAVAVIAAIVSAPFVLAFSGFIWYVLILAALITMAVMFSKINKEYKA